MLLTLTATPGDRCVTLRVTNASPYYRTVRLFRDGESFINLKLLPLETTCEYTDDLLENGQAYTYRACLVDNAGVPFCYTNDASATPSNPDDKEMVCGLEVKTVSGFLFLIDPDSRNHVASVHKDKLQLVSSALRWYIENRSKIQDKIDDLRRQIYDLEAKLKG